jgi:RimJ/RimL family protein N-acetyltransferase
VLIGELVQLRAPLEADVAVLHAELYEDVATRSRSDSRPWVPLGVSDSPFALHGPKPDAAEFSIVESASGELAGGAVLWQIDRHNRSAHVGLSLRTKFRGRGLGTDIVNVLTRYGTSTLGLHRLQIETAADNPAMIAAATRAGYVQEGRLRHAGWADGTFVDQIVLGWVADSD